ncbi:MAG: 16S rRNA (cytosine(1402)-N(4))-methyltransferase [Candidatus Moranbacteria bacterium CG_4_9_14_3_um_filter_33_15]|nr:MAG: 16S rRNA (cytosine(1402)-N(4))-methyltransferase [Candidatus Moranbacteria bacterium CG_4_9_14_3_um_filter_33_15]
MSIHKSVLLKEVIEILNVGENDVVIDATLGGGGHSLEILKKMKKSGRLIAFDADKEAIERFELKNFEIEKKIFLVNENFAKLKDVLSNLKIDKVNAILADLGWSSDQLIGKGISFQKDERLDMRLNKNQKLTAYAVVNQYPREKLKRVIEKYGEERFAGRIAFSIIKRRTEKKIETTKDLAEIIEKVIGKRYRNQKINSATRTFQALRIEVNEELDNLEIFLRSSIEKLEKEGRLAVISFHSLEDRIVKNIFRENARGCICPKSFPVCICGKEPIVKVVTSKPIIPKIFEIEKNPRARSAKLRVCEKI